MKGYHVTQVLKQGINIKTMCPNYVLKYTNSHLLQVYLGACVKIESVVQNRVC